MKKSLTYLFFLLLIQAPLFAQPGNSLHFDGMNDYVTIANANSLDLTGSYTLECWFKADALTSLSGLISKYHSPGADGYTLRLSGTSPFSGLDFDGMTTANNILTAGVWYHVAAVNNGGTRKLYLNGVEQTLSGSSYTTLANLNNVTLGVDFLSGGGRFLNGNMDEVRLWNTARTQSQIQSSMLITINPASSGLVAYYRMNQGTAAGNNAGVTSLTDLTSNANDGIPLGFAMNGASSNILESFAMTVPVMDSPTNIGQTSFTANWSIFGLGNLDHYLLDVSVAPDFSSFVSGYNGLNVGLATSWDVTGLYYANTYYCRVRAVHATLGQSISLSSSSVFVAGNGIRYVKPTASGSGDGSSWANASADLQAMINTAGTEVWVAAGTYKPTSGTDRNISFSLRNNISIYGGFTGSETQVSQRNFRTNATILSGDIGATGDMSDNSFHVILNFDNGVNSSAILDGFTLTKGMANGPVNSSSDGSGGGMYNYYASPTITNCIFSENMSSFSGNGLCNTYSNAIITNCVFVNNTNAAAQTAHGGGGISNDDGSPVIINCVFANNEARQGGGIRNRFSTSASIINCTFIGNSSSINGAGIANQTSASTISNCVVWGNTGVGTLGIYDFQFIGTVSNCIVQDGYPGNSGSDPLFRDNGDVDGSDNIWGTADDGLILSPLSPGINTGDNSSIGSTTTDITGAARIQDATVDMGAYESVPFTSSTVYVNQAVTTSGDGTSWASALKEVRDALSIANSYSSVTSIWVAAGTYQPTAGTDRNISFVMKNNLAIYGGFAGTETQLSQRNFRTNVSILSGDIGVSGDNTDNTYHVIFNESNGLNSSAVLDGFTISNGNASGITPFGGGIYNHNVGNLMFSNCIIRDNTAGIAGGGCINDNSNAALINCFFISNSSPGNLGGGLYLNASASQVMNCVFSNNTSNAGGGIRISAGSNAAITNCTFTGNNASSGAAIEVSAGSTPLITNSVFWGNIGIAIVNSASTPGNPTVAHCIVQGGYTGTANSSSDPLFLNAADLDGADNMLGTADDGLTLTLFSPGINTGDNTSVGTVTTDITGEARIQNTTVDMGAYEATAFTASTLYVNQAVTLSGDGTSWATALKEVREALALANTYSSVTSIWVAAGTYQPTAGTDRNISFAMKNNLAIYGGFAGTETQLSQRNFRTNVSVLSADIGVVGDNSDNSYHVILNYDNGLNSSAVLDGFTITKGNANGVIPFGGGIYNYASANPVISNCIFRDNSANNAGGGCMNNTSSATITNCFFESNTVPGSFGGAIYFLGSASPITNCVFSNNSANIGGAMRIAASSNVSIINCTFTGNNSLSGSAIEVTTASSPVIANCIFWGNLGASPAIVNSITNPGTPTVTHCIIQGGYTGTANSSSDPLFLNAADLDGADNMLGTADDGLSLTLFSPGINTGDNTSVGTVTTDITGAARIQNTTVDMGAYEGAVFSGNKLYVNQSVATSGDGTSWATAVKELRDALPVAITYTQIDSILVAGGVYKTTATNNSFISFNITRGKLKLFGGFDNSGNGTRDISGNPTYLDGDINTPVNTNNTQTVLSISNISAGADSVVIDGFTVRNGYSINTGSGAFINNVANGAKTCLRNCTFSACNAAFGAGAAANNSTPSFVDCNFTGNNSSNTGGGLFLQNCDDIVITNCNFLGNSAENNGGGVYTVDCSTTTFNNCNFTTNAATGAYGGGLYAVNGRTVMNNCIVTGNIADANGGGFYCGGSGQVESSNFTGNKSTNGGGGAIFQDISAGVEELLLRNSMFASDTALYGGAIRIQGSLTNRFTATGNVFKSNISTTGGGGAINYNGVGTDTLVNNLFLLNSDISGSGVGGAVAIASGSMNYVVNNTFYQNTANDGGAVAIVGGTTKQYNNIFYKNTANTGIAFNDVAGTYTGTNNLFGTTDPAFVNENDPDGADDTFSTADDGLKLHAISAATNGGDLSKIPAGITVDITGASRTQNGAPDMGAYEGASFTGNIVYVDQSVPITGDGNSWASACKELRDALALARNFSSVQTIWVASGTYKPTSGTDRNAAFIMKNNLDIYGGFAGTETTLSQRDFRTNISIMSGDIGAIGNNSDNSYHVVFNNNNGLNSSAVLDGFTVTKGNANGTSPFGGGIDNFGNTNPVISNCIIRENSAAAAGGGCMNNSSSATIQNCFFVSNTTGVTGFGGGLYIYESSSQVANCVFINNVAGNIGGALRIAGSSTASITNCTFTGNNAPLGAAIEVSSSSPLIANSIFWGNLITSAAILNSTTSPGTPVVTNCIVQGGFTGTGNSSSDPLFLDMADPDGIDNIWGTADDGLSLTPSSPALDSGDNTNIPVGITTDITGAARIQNGTVDMGAYEGGSAVLPVTLVSFSGKVNISEIDLTWDVADQTEIQSYEIERSSTGFNFETIGTVIANKLSNWKYGFRDMQPLPGINYYRLKMIESQHYEYSNIIGIEFKSKNAVFLYPQPASTYVTIGGGSEEFLNTQAFITDMTGGFVREISITELPMQVDLDYLSPGIYLLHLADDTTLKLIIQ